MALSDQEKGVIKIFVDGLPEVLEGIAEVFSVPELAQAAKTVKTISNTAVGAFIMDFVAKRSQTAVEYARGGAVIEDRGVAGLPPLVEFEED